MIRFVCSCGRQLQARPESAGKVVLCPACKQRVTVPDEAPTSIQSEEPVERTPPRQSVRREQPVPRDDSESETEGRDRPSRRGSSESSGKAIASLILGLVSCCGCACLTGLPAILMGVLALLDIGRQAGRLTGKPMAVIGIVFGSLGTLLLPLAYYFGMTMVTSRVREAGDRAKARQNLLQMALAMHNYNDVSSALPRAGIGDPRLPAAQQKPLLSWRVALLPYLEQEALYRQFKLDEPWDGPNNIKLLGKMPSIYKLPGDTKTPPDHTHYQVFVGNGAAFEPSRATRLPGDFPDGTSNTILIVEAEKAVPWTKPEDIPFDPSKPVLPLFSTHFRGGFQVVMADGSVRLVTQAVSEPTLKNAIGRKDGQPLGADW